MISFLFIGSHIADTFSHRLTVRLRWIRIASFWLIKSIWLAIHTSYRSLSRCSICCNIRWSVHCQMCMTRIMNWMFIIILRSHGCSVMIKLSLYYLLLLQIDTLVIELTVCVSWSGMDTLVRLSNWTSLPTDYLCISYIMVASWQVWLRTRYLMADCRIECVDMSSSFGSMIVLSTQACVTILLLKLHEYFIELVLAAFEIFLPDKVRRNQQQIWLKLLLTVVNTNPSFVTQ